MKKIQNLLLVIAALITGFSISAGTASARKADVQQLYKDIRVIVKSMNSQDDELGLKYTWPDLIEIAGGKAKILETIKTIRKNDEGNKYKYTDVKFHKPVKFYRNGRKRFAVVPYLMTIKQTGKLNRTTKGEFYYLAIKNSRKSRWTYVEGALFFVLNIREFVDDFPQEVNFPQARIISQKEVAPAK